MRMSNALVVGHKATNLLQVCMCSVMCENSSIMMNLWCVTETWNVSLCMSNQLSVPTVRFVTAKVIHCVKSVTRYQKIRGLVEGACSATLKQCGICLLQPISFFPEAILWCMDCGEVWDTVSTSFHNYMLREVKESLNCTQTNYLIEVQDRKKH